MQVRRWLLAESSWVRECERVRLGASDCDQVVRVRVRAVVQRKRGRERGRRVGERDRNSDEDENEGAGLSVHVSESEIGCGIARDLAAQVEERGLLVDLVGDVVEARDGPRLVHGQLLDLHKVLALGGKAA